VKRRSIRFRLTAWYSLILAATLAVVGVGVWFALQDSIDETVDKELRSRIQEMREYFSRGSHDGGQPIKELSEDAAFAPAGTRFRIAAVDGGWLFRSPGTVAWGGAPNAANLPKRGLSQTIYEHGQPIRVLSQTGPPGVIQIGMPLDEFSEMVSGFAWIALLASPILLLLASAGGYWMSRRALAPVDVITRAAGEIEAKDLSQRLPTLGTGDELDQLSAKLNGMFGRLDDSFRRIAQFTADASHELRTPVSIIRTTAEVTLTRARSQDEYAKALRQILSESERTTALIEDLMLLARADASEENAPLEPVDLAELTRNACEDARLLAAGKSLALTVTGGDCCSVRGDYEALRRLVLILIDNAIKYSHSGGNIQLHLGSQASGKRNTALLEVRDHGIGIRPDDLPRIFERFYRVSEDRSRRVDGFGLGLSIAQSIVVRHGGEIQVESLEGAGSVFRVLLPTA
jgi:heavy metal sensor kinase